MEIIEGEPFVLNVSASARPSRIDYKWEKESERNLDSSPNTDVWFNGGLLHIPKVSKSHAGSYVIRANNSEGATMTEVRLDVLFAPKISNISEPVMVDSGEDAMFECTFTANPIMYDGIQWLRHNIQIEETEAIVTDSSRRFSIDWDDIGGNMVRTRLVIRNATVQDAGKIFCAISNGYGEQARSQTYLLVKRKYY